MHDIFSKRGRAQLERIKAVITRNDELQEELELLDIHEKKLERVEGQIKEALNYCGLKPAGLC
jgi:alpha-galactosidase/6-phospho-beta-glucosidase family protein